MEKELEKYSEITDLNFDQPNPHIAVTHKSQGYSANLRHKALLFKSGSNPITKEVIKSLKGTMSEQDIIKMSMENKRKVLEELIKDRIRAEMAGNGEYVCVWIQDFNESMAVFSYEGKLGAVEYTESEDGTVVIGENFRYVRHRDMYVDSESGEELIKSFADLVGNPEVDEKDSEADGEQSGDNSDTTPSTQKSNEENVMAQEEVTKSKEDLLKDPTVQELLKAQEAKQAELIKQAIEADRKEREHQELVKSTSELVKGFSFVGEDKQEVLVKALTSGEEGVELIKALSDAQEKISGLEKEVEEVKKEFGKGTAIEGEADKTEITKGGDKTAQLTEIVKQKLAAKAK